MRLLWKLCIPKDRLIAMLDAMDTDSDGFISFEEVLHAIKVYAKAVKRSMRFSRKE